MRAQNLLVLCGGRSAERDVSCVSSAAVLRNLSSRYRPCLVRIDPQGRWFFQRSPTAFAVHPEPQSFPFDRIPARLEPGPKPALVVGGAGKERRIRVDVVFPVLHGPLGEDGSMQGYLEIIGLPYVGAGVLGSAVSMDKEVSKRLAVHAGLPVLPYAVLRDPSVRPDRAASGWVRIPGAEGSERLRLPVFVKPCRLGSSVGISKVSRASELRRALSHAFRYDTTVVVERGVEAREIECSVLGGGTRTEASVPGEIRPNADFYSYKAKYLDPDGARLMIPAELSRARAREVRDLAVRTFRVLDCHGMARVDFLLDRRTGKLWFNEVNTIPGFTAISMYPKLWGASGLSFPRLVDRLLSIAIARHRERTRLIARVPK